MNVDELTQLPCNAIDVLVSEGITKLNIPQILAIKAGLLDSKSIIVSAPTASGKTFIAEMAILNTVLNNHKKAVYIVPLKALGSEKYEEFTKKYESLGIKVGISMGDYDSKDLWLKTRDIIIVTSEKLDSLMRHNVPWVDDIGLIVVDEIHMLNDINRGSTLEITITRLKDIIERKNKFQFLGLSATISNSNELAAWLECELVKSDYRPIPLKKGVYFDGVAKYNKDKEEIKQIHDIDLENVVDHYLKNKKQLLIFVNSRRSAEAQAEKLRKIVEKHTNLEFMSELALEAKEALKSPTRQCRRLAKCIEKGTSFHHAGLVQKQRKLIEDSFKSKVLKVICATPTLAMGVNLPSSVVVIKDVMRYAGNYGMRPIPVLEYEQMAGRAGRPKYDKEGTAIIMARSQNDIERLFDTYIHADTEKIFSKLALEPVLRMHILSLIATGHVYTEDQLNEFMEKTFYAHQYTDMSDLKQKIKKMLRLLWKYNLIEMETSGDINDTGLFVSANAYVEVFKLKATLLGLRVAQMYIDPETANLFIESMKNTTNKKINEFSFLHLIVNALELYPQIRLRKDDYESINSVMAQYANFMIVPENLVSYDTYQTSVKTALMFNSWIDEVEEDALLEKYNVTPGELHVKLTTADWLLYALYEIGRLTHHTEFQKDLSDLRIRLKYGVKRELLPLISLKNIGRIRARKLFDAGLKTANDIKNSDIKKLEKIVGVKVANGLKG
ncbi:DEAD/DEAH box helicase [archaeon]|nr:DEAD/DEAH box helicase [archaeon]